MPSVAAEPRAGRPSRSSSRCSATTAGALSSEYWVPAAAIKFCLCGNIKDPGVQLFHPLRNDHPHPHAGRSVAPAIITLPMDKFVLRLYRAQFPSQPGIITGPITAVLCKLSLLYPDIE